MSARQLVRQKSAEETIGRRIARLRQECGWTQQALAERLAISRVAVSHIEMNLSLPSERTVILLAGLFKLAPHDLVASTSYPAAKAERLPLVTNSYTPLELDLALQENDLGWLVKLAAMGIPQASLERLSCASRLRWAERLQSWEGAALDERDGALLERVRQHLVEIDKLQTTISEDISPADEPGWR